MQIDINKKNYMHAEVTPEIQNMYQLHTIEEALEDLRQGKLLIVVDDEDRENEGDIVLAADHVTSATVNFMAKEARQPRKLFSRSQAALEQGREGMLKHDALARKKPTHRI